MRIADSSRVHLCIARFIQLVTGGHMARQDQVQIIFASSLLLERREKHEEAESERWNWRWRERQSHTRRYIQTKNMKLSDLWSGKRHRTSIWAPQAPLPSLSFCLFVWSICSSVKNGNSCCECFFPATTGKTYTCRGKREDIYLRRPRKLERGPQEYTRFKGRGS